MRRSSAQGTLPLDRAFAFIVLRTSRLLRYHFQHMAVAHGIDLSPEQWLILNRLTEEDGLAQRELTSETFRDRPNVSRMLGSLERRRLIRRRTDPRDARRFCIHLTARGRRLHEELVPIVQRERRAVYRGLTEADFDQLRRILDRLDANLLTTIDGLGAKK